MFDEFRFNPEHAIPEARKHVPACVSRAPSNFNDGANFWSQKVAHYASNRDLATKANSELRRAKSEPEKLFGRSG